MKHLITGLAVVALFSLPAVSFATGNNGNGSVHHNSTQNTTVNVGNGFGNFSPSARSFAAAAAGSVAKATAPTTITVTGDTYTNPKQAASPGSVSVTTTANCRIAGGVSFSGPFGGGSVGGSILDENCEELEIIKAAAAVGTDKQKREAQDLLQARLDEMKARREAKKEAAVRPTAKNDEAFASFSN